jgi:hypothetical protein
MKAVAAVGLQLRVATLVFLALSLSAPPVSAARTIPYGTRVGMQVTVKSATGLDTAHAVIQAEHTRDDAIKFCRDYIGKVTEDCIKGELATQLKDSISADCTKGTFTDFFGDQIAYHGRNPKDGPKYVLIDNGIREIHDDVSGSDYYGNMKLFQALCPRTAPARP